MSTSSHSATQRFGLMSARSAKRWSHRLVFVWLGMWLSTALLACCEVEAAVAAYEHAQGSDCGHPAEPASGSGHKAAACLDIDEPAPASADRLAGPVTGNDIQLALAVSAATYILPSLPAPPIPRAYQVAQPSVAAYLGSSRLLI